MKKIGIILFLLLTTLFLASACSNTIGDEVKKEFKITGEASLYVDEETSLSVEGFDASKIVWTSSDSSIATVENGVVKGVGVGKVKILARIGGYGDSFTLNVLESGTFNVGEYTERVKELLSNMTIEQKVGELFMVGLEGESLTDEEKQIIDDYKFANFYLSANNISDASALTALTKELQNIAMKNNGVTAFIATTSSLGKENALYNINDINLSSHAILALSELENVRRAGNVIGEELSNYGINFDFIRSLNSRTGQSSRDVGAVSSDAFSDEANIVGEYASAFIKSINECGVVSAGGLFPVFNNEEKDIGPSDDYFDAFREAFKNGLDAIVINDVIYTLLDNKNPAIKSSNVINDFLITKLGFSGIVCTTDMNSFSVKQSKSTELYSKNAIVSLYAGVNMFYFSSMSATCLEYYDDIIRAYNTELISLDVIDEAVATILAVKMKHGITEYNEDSVSSEFDYSKRNTLARDLKQYVVTQTSEMEFLPIGKDGKVLFVSFTFDFASGEESLGEEFKRIAVEKGYSAELIKLYSVEEPRELRYLFNPDRSAFIGYIEEYGDLSEYDRIIIAPPINTSSQGSGWGRLNLGDLRGYTSRFENVHYISTGTSDVSDAMNSIFPTLMVYGEEEADLQVLIAWLFGNRQ